MLRYAAAWPLLLASAAAAADSTEEQPQSRADAWWTGPMLAPNAATLPRGYALLEPYLFDIITSGHFDANGNKHAGPLEHDLGSLTYMLYGVTNNITAGLIPRFLFEEPAGAANSSGIRLGDLTRASDGVGAGAYTTSINLYLQDYFWMPNGRILRGRLDLTYGHSSSVSVQDASVYGRANGFRGHAYPGDAFTADAAAEYSLTRNWVLAFDVVYQHNDSTRVTGTAAPGGLPLEHASGSSYSLGFAPAIEYNLSSTLGVLLGVRIIEIGRNTDATVTPAIAVNMVL